MQSVSTEVEQEAEPSSWATETLGKKFAKFLIDEAYIVNC